jgi:hypothetical protein
MFIGRDRFCLFVGWVYARFYVSIEWGDKKAGRPGGLEDRHYQIGIQVARPQFVYTFDEDRSSLWTGRRYKLTGFRWENTVVVFNYARRVFWLKPLGLGSGRYNWVGL